MKPSEAPPHMTDEQLQPLLLEVAREAMRPFLGQAMTVDTLTEMYQAGREAVAAWLSAYDAQARPPYTVTY